MCQSLETLGKRRNETMSKNKIENEKEKKGFRKTRKTSTSENSIQSCEPVNLAPETLRKLEKKTYEKKGREIETAN